LAAEVVAILALQCRRDFLRGREGAVHVILKKLLQFRSPLLEPLLLARDALAAQLDKRVGQLRMRWQLADVREVGVSQCRSQEQEGPKESEAMASGQGEDEIHEVDSGLGGLLAAQAPSIPSSEGHA